MKRKKLSSMITILPNIKHEKVIFPTEIHILKYVLRVI